MRAKGRNAARMLACQRLHGQDPIMRRKARASSSPHNKPRFWGRHPVAAALANPERTVRKIMGTREALAGFDLPAAVPVTFAEATDLARLVPGDAPHQGVVIEVEPLEPPFPRFDRFDRLATA